MYIKMKSKIYPQEKYKEKIDEFKKKILVNIEQNLDNYQIFKIKNQKEFDFILVKKNSIHDNVLKSTLPVNNPIIL